MAPQDSFIDEEEDVCPLCIEEFDLSDKNFRPCPCGYQVCQFCFNNIKNNMNGLCPACRRPYDEKTIQYKVVTQEEVAQFRANIQKNQKKRVQEQRQKEVLKREAEKETRKNLVGVRVVQKNLVYITGLAPNVREDDLLKTLRKHEFFGQYGNIQKISISNRKSPDGQHHSLGIYVTFQTPDEAMRCIQAVHGSNNGDRVLKAQHGTTKYCSAWLKNEKCNNPGCMFLHEQGDEEDSYTRQDLSSMNSIHTQRPLPGGSGPSRASSRQLSHPTPPPMPVPVSGPAPVAQAMARSLSKEESDAGDSSALPSSANWARLPVRSRRGSYATSGAASSPAVSAAVPEKQEPIDVPEPSGSKASSSKSKSAAPASRSNSPRATKSVSPPSAIKQLLAILSTCTLPNCTTQPGEESGPPRFDLRGGEKRRVMREDKDSRTAHEDQIEVPEGSEDDVETGGSLALGGEPEGRDRLGDGHPYSQRHITPIQRSSTDGVFSPSLAGSAFGGVGTSATPRSMTPHQMGLRSQAGYTEQFPPGIGGPSNSFLGQGQGQGHNRQSSRFNFANESGASATNIKLAANPRIMAQQSSMMPSSFQSQGNQFYASSMPGPPPGLKSTGTPPSMFAQGFSSSGYNVPKDNSNDLLQSLLGRNRGSNQSHESGKRESLLSSLSSQYPSTSTPAPASGLLASLYGNHPGAFQDFASKQKKKGKKHRHANTSSSGGSGLVDLADPSILQARMQHQTQSNAGAGQGLFNGQNQGGYNNPNMMYNYGHDELPSLADAASSVDALVGDEVDDLTTSFDGYATTTHSHGHPEPSQSYASAGSSVTGHGHPSPEASARRPPPGFEPRSLTASREQVSTSASAPPVKAEPAQKKKTLKDEEFPALNSPTVAKGSSTASPAPVIAIPNISFQAKQVVSKRSGTSQGFGDSRRGSLNNDNEPDEKEKATTRPAATPRTGPKTLRVMTPARIESPSIMSPVATRILSGGQRPETPVSETISDSASIVSASVSASRAGSPPPSRVGSAPVRTVTKSMQRKQRKDALKQDTKAIAEAAVAEEAVHEPITSHKKKQKKERQVKEKAASSSTSGVSRAGTSKEVPKNVEQEDESTAEKKAQPDEKTPKGLEQTVLLPTQPQPQSQPPAPTVQEPTSEDDEPAAPPQGPSTVFADIRQSLWARTVDRLNLLKPVAGLSCFAKQQQVTGNKPGSCKDIGCKCGEILPEDLAVLASYEPVRKQCRLDGSRVLLTPYGDCIRRLTEEEEDDFLELQRAVALTAESAGCFTSPRHQKSSGAFSIVKGRAVPNGRPNIFPSAFRPESQDPFGKLQRDEALSYINQYVLPRLNLGASGKAAAAASGSLAPLRDAAAASLNSLAPYFYGPEAAAGVGIYSAVDSGGARPVHDFGAPPGLTLGGNVDMVKGAGARSVGAMALMSVDEADAALAATRKDTEKLEKGLNAVIRKNRRLLIGSD
ncbi:Zinc finger, RING/FYVE/PHD-type [Cordyceps fumosorosea ARSEF 2679]|uniref:Zinc finger, RING/FYVE/PHD-type n=1 Tax=Cordyceps fumosorosea (strain ARSEF 2679) TaxID=1081104 RepID=A0A167NWQ3_CORFA|nr:Zinc finger, RING/FYVE/PHD-type [Cordyceps fumosorosea ARSEF 2679]OAA56031.1 Zinc finger, RING/FYVE/PHD-type [Cordyceps fumosorosea ARSEF 2679]